MIHIGIDVDGVLRDFRAQLMKVYKDLNPEHQVTPLNEWYNYRLDEYFPESEDIGKFIFHDNCRLIFLYAKAYEGAKEFMKQLNKNPNYRVTIVSSQSTPELQSLTIEWLYQEGIDYDAILFTDDKVEYYGHFLLDDKTKNVRRAYMNNITRGVVFDQVYNRDCELMRVKNYQEFLDLVEAFERDYNARNDS